MASSLRRFGARLMGIVTAANLDDPAAWDALAECDGAEFRADTFGSAAGLPAAAPILSGLARLRSEAGRRKLSLERLFTLRLARDGGNWPDADAAGRTEVWEAVSGVAADSVPEWIDVEIEAYPDLPDALRVRFRSAGIRLLLSHHDFSGRPDLPRLRSQLADMRAARPDGIKFAVACASREQLADLAVFAREAAAASPRACVLAMGSAGRALRVLGPALGCPQAYAFLSGGAVAPGQFAAPELGRWLDCFAAELPPDLLVPGVEARLIAWAEARLAGSSIDYSAAH